MCPRAVGEPDNDRFVDRRLRRRQRRPALVALRDDAPRDDASM
jgi:hypothetical protein